MAEDLYALDLEVDLDSAHYGGLASRNPATDVTFDREAYHASGLSVLVYANTKLPAAGIVNGGDFNINACLGLMFQGNFIFIQHVLLVV